MESKFKDSRVREVLQDPANQQLIQQSKFSELYTRFLNLPAESDRSFIPGIVTEILYEAGIDPLKYMTYIPAYFFSNSPRFSSFFVPTGISDISKYAFAACDIMKELSLPGALSVVSAKPFLYQLQNLETLILREGITGISAGCFMGKNHLQKVEFPKTLKVIGEGAFADCLSLQEVKIPPTTTRLLNQAFAGCESLYRVSIQSTKLSINRQVFQSCSKLQSLYLSAGVIEIQEEAFSDCPSITDVFYEGTEEQWKAINIKSGNKSILNASIHFNA